MQRGGQKFEGTPRSEQKWMGEQKRSGDLSSRQKLLSEWTGEWTYRMDMAG